MTIIFIIVFTGVLAFESVEDHPEQLLFIDLLKCLLNHFSGCSTIANHKDYSIDKFAENTGFCRHLNGGESRMMYLSS